MKIVIDISKDIIEHIKDGSFGARPDDRYTLVTAVMDGTQLPKGYGRLIDADVLVSKAYEEAQGMTNNNFGVEIEWLVDKSPTIIEADKETEE